MPFKQIKFVFSILISFSISSVFAGTFIVDDSYNGTNSSTACLQQVGAQYFSTLAAARLAAQVVVAPPAHTIKICPGSYAGNNTFNHANLVGLSIEGTTSDPNDVVINGTGTGSVIYLRKADMSVKNISIVGGGFGVRTYLATSAEMNNVVVKSQRYDGMLLQSTDNKVINTIIDSPRRMGIYSTTGTNLTIESTEIINTGSHGLNYRRGGGVIKNVTIKDANGYGAFLYKTTAAPQNLLIDELHVENTRYDGLYLRGYNASAPSDNVNINNLSIVNAGRYGMYLIASKRLEFNNIKIESSKNDSIYMNNIDDSYLSNVSIENSGGDGLYTTSTSSNNKISGLSIKNSTAYGVYNNGSDNNTYDEIEISNTNGAYGMYFVSTSLNNSISNYKIYDNKTGIQINNSRENSFTQGEVYNNTNGFILTTNARDNQITTNYIHDNSTFGLNILSGGTNSYNDIYQNCFINPAININNTDTGTTNDFDNGTTGNYYGSVPSGTGYSETCVDANSDLICDTPYTIPGVSGDLDNFPSKNLTSINAACIAGLTYPDINFKKTVSVKSDPINMTVNPKAIPGAVVEYSLKATNDGLGAADLDSISITDKLPANTLLVFGSPASPATFIDGSPSSGLTYNFNSLGSTTDDIQFSNNGGVTFVTPTVDADGIDATSPPINYIKVIPKGTFNPKTISGSPSFFINYEVKVQ